MSGVEQRFRRALQRIEFYIEQAPEIEQTEGLLEIDQRHTTDIQQKLVGDQMGTEREWNNPSVGAYLKTGTG